MTLIVPIILVVVVLFLIGLITWLVRRSSAEQQRTGEQSEVRRRQRGDERP